MFRHEWRTFARNLSERLDVDKRVLTVAEIAQIPFADQVREPHRCNE